MLPFFRIIKKKLKLNERRASEILFKIILSYLNKTYQIIIVVIVNTFLSYS